ncbi:MAG: Ppx/GppA phosphatase family protein [Candidatus Dormibacteria bacterium]
MARAPRFAAIDIGSNTVHLLVAACPQQRLPQPVLRRRAFVQLGEDVRARGEIGDERASRAAETVRYQVQEARRQGAEAVALGATQALRAARNGQEVAERLAAAGGGGPVRVLTSAVEAQLAFDGATMTISPGRQTVVLDIGGASAEVAVGSAGQRCHHDSLPLGSGMISALAATDPPSEDDWLLMQHEVTRRLPDLVPLPSEAVKLGTGGTITNLPRLLGHPRGALLLLREVEQLLRAFAREAVATLSERSGVEPERVRLCRGGALILAQLMDLLHLDSVRASERGLRDGMIAALVGRGDDWWRSAEGGASAALATVLLPGAPGG